MKDSIKIINYTRSSNHRMKDKNIYNELIKELNIILKIKDSFAGCIVIIQDKVLLDRLSNVIKENMINSGIGFLEKRANDLNYNVFYNAPVVILFFAEENNLWDEYCCMAVVEEVFVFSKSLNLNAFRSEVTSLLFASDQGEEFKRKFEIPDKYNVICSIVFGYKINSKSFKRLAK